MLQLDLEKKLDSMSKEAILEQIATQIDTIIAKKVEAENAKAEALRVYKKAQERVSLGTYGSEDLIILQRALNDRKRGMNTTPHMSKPINEAPSCKGKAIPSSEIEGILKALGLSL